VILGKMFRGFGGIWDGGFCMNVRGFGQNVGVILHEVVMSLAMVWTSVPKK
jgi:hypothetical protein